MKIATWNIERQLKSNKKFDSIIDTLKGINADILILTETNKELELGEQYSAHHTSKPTESFYKESETRVTIFSKYLSLGQIETFRSDTSICNILKTPFGKLAVYGTIIGNYGNRMPSFEEDLEMQILDFQPHEESQIEAFQNPSEFRVFEIQPNVWGVFLDPLPK